MANFIDLCARLRCSLEGLITSEEASAPGVTYYQGTLSQSLKPEPP